MANKTVAIKADNWTDIPLVYQDNGDGTYSPTAATVGQGKLTLVTPVLDTSAYVSGDVLFVPIAFNGARVNGGRSYLQSLVAVDSDDQGYAMELYFFSETVTLGTINSAPSISDADALKFLGMVSLSTGDWIDLGGVRVATLRSIGLMMVPNAASTNLFVAGITRGTPTHTASGLQLSLGMLWD
jgi:hypothetical protein